MSTSALVDLDIDQGADFGVQFYWTTMDQTPFTVLAPMRMEIRDEMGSTMYTLATADGGATDTQTILYNSDTGLIQLLIPSSATKYFPPGRYSYDLFVTYQDNDITNATRLHKLVQGSIYVEGRVTQTV